MKRMVLSTEVAYGASPCLDASEAHTAWRHYWSAQVQTATCLRAAYYVPGTENGLWCCTVSHSTVLRSTDTADGTGAVLATVQCYMVLTLRMVLQPLRALHQPPLKYLWATGQRDHALASLQVGAIGLRACYAMPATGLLYAASTVREHGTELVRGAIGLRACYAMPGTEIASGLVGLGACYAKAGTELAYHATRTS
eukprot:426412-Rhodomonas_salina.1